jgi:hypothetical protein
MYRAIPVAAVLTITLIAGCGSSDSAKDGSPSAGAGDDRSATKQNASAGKSELEMENRIADCMKKEGFTYIPRPSLSRERATDTPQMKYGTPRSILLPDAEVRAWRQKYGFGIIAGMVYPNDPQVASRSPQKQANPNNAIVEGLDPARRRAYNKALTGSPDQSLPEIKGDTKPTKQQGQQIKDFDASCTGTFGVTDSVDGAPPASAEKKEAARRLMAKFTNDPAVIKAAEKFGTCMKKRGYTLDSIGIDPWQVAGAAHNDEAGYERATKSTSAAKRELVKETEKAVADVDCRVPYSEIVRSKYPTILETADVMGVG